MSNYYKSPLVGHEISCVMTGLNPTFFEKNALIERTIKEALKKDNFNVLDFLSFNFQPQGFTALVLLSESHLAIHTYPEHNAIYFNMYSCRGPRDAKKTFYEIKKKLNPEKIIFLKDNQIPLAILSELSEAIH